MELCSVAQEPKIFKLVGEAKMLAKLRLVTRAGDYQEETWQIVIPPHLIDSTIRLFHGKQSVLGHVGTAKTYNLIADRFYWKGMRRDIRKFIASCDLCMRRVRTPPKHRRYTFHGGQEAPNNRIAVDIVGPLPTTKGGYCYIMTIFDVFSHWVEAYPLSRTQAEDVIRCLKLYMSRHGVPASLLSDRGSNFLSKKVLEFLKEVGTRKVTTSPYHAASNGSIEGFHKFLAKGLSMLVNETHSDWDDHLPAVLFQYRTSPMDDTGVSPFEVTTGRRPNLPIDHLLQLGQAFQGQNSPAQHADRAHEFVQSLRPYVQGVHKRRFERNQASEPNLPRRTFAVGDRVYLKFPKGRFRPAGGSTKLSMVNEGPYVVTQLHENPLVFGVRNEITKHQSNVFVARMIPFEEWQPPNDSIEFPFQPVEDKGGSAQQGTPQETQLPLEDRQDAEEPYKYLGQSEQTPEQQRQTFQSDTKRRKLRAPGSNQPEDSSLRKPRTHTKEDEIKARAERAAVRARTLTSLEAENHRGDFSSEWSPRRQTRPSPTHKQPQRANRAPVLLRLTRPSTPREKTQHEQADGAPLFLRHQHGLE